MEVKIEVGSDVFDLLDALDDIMGMIPLNHIEEAYRLRGEITRILGDLVVVE